MLFNIVCVMAIVYMCTLPFLFAYFVVSIKENAKPGENPIKTIQKYSKKKKLDLEAAEEYIKDLQVLANVDRFDGTSAGQVKIKE